MGATISDFMLYVQTLYALKMMDVHYQANTEAVAA
jgi:hypothetical protein